MMASVIMAVLMLCTGDVCRMADGYPMVFETESACVRHLLAVSASMVEATDPDATVAMACAFDFRALPGTLPGTPQ